MQESGLKIVLEGIVGSKAYGLDTPESDVDVKGVYVALTQKVLSLWKPKEAIAHTKPDYTYYEIEKFIKLALKCNPSIIEMLHLSEYSVYTIEGQLLITNRKKFLSTNAVVQAYADYACSQAKWLENRANSPLGPHKRHEKHAMHCLLKIRRL